MNSSSRGGVKGRYSCSNCDDNTVIVVEAVDFESEENDTMY